MYTRETTIDLRIVRAAGDSGEEPQRSLRCHFAFMSASAVAALAYALQFEGTMR
jgi:hypothetical protein